MFSVPKTVPEMVTVSPMNLKLQRTNWNIIYDKNLPFFCFMSFLGMWPIRRNKNGVVEFKLKSWITIYTLVVLFAETGISFYITPELLKMITSEKMGFENGILFSALLSYTIINAIPVLSLFEASKMASYLKEWDRYQVFYDTSLKKSDTIKPKPSLMTPIILVISGVATYFLFISIAAGRYKIIFLDIDPDSLPLFYLCLCVFLISVLTLICYFYLWFLLTSAIQTAGEQIISHLEVQISVTRDLRPYQQLRMLLRNLSQKLGNTYGLTYLYIILLFYGIGLPLTYVAVILMNQGDYAYSFAPIQQFGGITLLAHLTHRAVEKLGSDFEDRLSKILIERKSLICEKELLSFIESVAATPVVFSLYGYFNLDRGINVPLYSSVITFLVIIVQFREEKPSCLHQSQ